MKNRKIIYSNIIGAFFILFICLFLSMSIAGENYVSVNVGRVLLCGVSLVSIYQIYFSILKIYASYKDKKILEVILWILFFGILAFSLILETFLGLVYFGILGNYTEGY